MKWYKKAADLGDDQAMNNIGLLYYNGCGVTKDYAEAGKWWKKAAALGNGDAVKNMNLLYKKD